MIQVGQRVRFDALEACTTSGDRITWNTVGVVAYVNERHNWFSVQYGGNQRISFMFSEIGHNVHLCK